MTIQDSLQTLGVNVFWRCSKLIPSKINVNDLHNDTTSEVVAHLRSEMSLNALLSGNNFLNTDDFRRLIVPYIPNDALMTIRLALKPWSRVTDEFISDGVESGTMIVHGGEDVWKSGSVLSERHTLVTRVIFLLYITKVGEHACEFAAKLVVIEISEGVESIGFNAFGGCECSTTISFPTTLTPIGMQAFYCCTSLESVDLLHTNLQELGEFAFDDCSELKSMTIPDSLQTLGQGVFYSCSKLVPSNVNYNAMSEVVNYLRSKQSSP
ncbi:hypothetical protein TL16_g03018 [Triparma laevis f. inornata]|uniref:Uncharacterized protein n=1 Tax=Triparma laevis f. inornata TaxID=1714386 RepID=A0A9W7DYY6_9STRA|nr:hypothetical protein TL16_g03018 [Triparma laevis f. inornata]